MHFVVSKTPLHTVFFKTLDATRESTEWGLLSLVEIKKQKCGLVE